MANVFISHSSKDKETADRLCALLEERGITCWIAPRDITPGEDWAKAINNAITACDVFLIMYSANSSESEQVPKEIGIAGARHKYIIPYKIDNTGLKDNFEYHLINCHWVVADIKKNDYKINELSSTISAVVNNPVGTGSVNVVNNIGSVNVSSFNNNKVASPSFDINKYKVPLISAVAVIALVIILVLVTGKPSGTVQDNEETIYADNKVTASETAVSTSSVENITEEQVTEEQVTEEQVTEEQITEKQVTEEKVTEEKPAEESIHIAEPVEKEKAEAVLSSEGVQVPVDLAPYEHTAEVLVRDPKKTFNVAGREYNTGILLTKSYGSYLLFNNADQGYTKMKFTAGHIDGESDNDKDIIIKYDGVEKEYLTLEAKSLQQDYEFDITGAELIEISIAQLPGDFDRVALTDFYFYNGTAPARETLTAENDVSAVPADLAPYEHTAEVLVRDPKKTFNVAGREYNTGILLTKSYGSYLLFNNADQGYTKMKFTAGHIDGESDNDKEIIIKYDGVEKEYLTLEAKSLQQDYEFDITGAELIEISIAQLPGDFDRVALTDFYFYNGTAPAREILTAENDVSAVPADLAPYEHTAEVLVRDPKKTFNVAGREYNTGILLTKSYGSYLLFNNADQGYTKMKFTAGHIDGESDNDKEIIIKYDGVEKEYVCLKAKSLPQDYEFDITGAELIEVSIVKLPGDFDRVALVDFEMSK